MEINHPAETMDFEFEEIASLEMVGEFEDEYVYDVEMEDDSHTFIANDILVHNSNFLTFAPILDSCGITGSDEEKLSFIIKFYNVFMKGFNQATMTTYAEKYGVKNLHDFEIEKIAKHGIWLGKKNYVLDIVWEEEGNLFYPSGKNMASKGIDIVKSSTPLFVREKLYNLVKWFLISADRRNTSALIKQLKAIKEEYRLAEIGAIAKTSSCNNYDKYVINDVTDVVLGPKCPAQVRAAAHYNYLIQNNADLKKKYPLIKEGDKVKFYYTVDLEMQVFGFLYGSFPYEVAPKIDFDLQFEKTVLSIVNRFTGVLDQPTINSNLTYITSILQLFKK